MGSFFCLALSSHGIGDDAVLALECFCFASRKFLVFRARLGRRRSFLRSPGLFISPNGYRNVLFYDMILYNVNLNLQIHHASSLFLALQNHVSPRCTFMTLQSTRACIHTTRRLTYLAFQKVDPNEKLVLID